MKIDHKMISTIILLFLILVPQFILAVEKQSKDSVLINEQFESETFPPPGWTLKNAYPEYEDGGFIHGILGVNIADTNSIWSGAQALHNFVGNDQDDWLISPQITVPADNFTSFSFMQQTNYISYYVHHSVSVSNDMINWTQLYTGHPAEDPENPDNSVWEKIVLNLSAYQGQEIYIGFNYQGYDADEWHIDDVLAAYDVSGPAVSSISGNVDLLPLTGAYVGNPMTLDLIIEDISGVSAVTGHYDISGIIGSAEFFKAKGSETWTGSVPEMSEPGSGTIYFDLTDIGGISTVSPEYSIQFVADPVAPVLKYCTGRSAFINNSMELKLVFQDESSIQSCTGFYSKDAWVTQYNFELNPSKINNYTYLGIIPAETSQVMDGKVKFTITDISGNTLNTGEFTVKWLDGTILYYEDFESGTDGWTLIGSWDLVTTDFISAAHSLTESPVGNYSANNNSFAEMSTTLDLSQGYMNADVSFWCRFDIEKDFDYMHFELSPDSGLTWNRVKTWTGEGVSWHEESFNLSLYLGCDDLKMRWVFESDGGVECEGMNIDDITVSVYYDYNTPPIIVHEGPQFFEGPLFAYESSATVIDFDGVDSVWVEYTIDNADSVFSDEATFTGSDVWEFAIPGQTTGTIINYVIHAKDSSTEHLHSFSDTFTYIAGHHDIYDDGYVSYYLPVLTNDAVAVKFDIGYDLWYLAGILVRNFSDGTHSSANMRIHLFEDNYGIPGNDILPPFDITPTADPDNPTAFTWIGPQYFEYAHLGGSFWIGVSAPYGTVYTTIESVDDPGITAYNRSFYGGWNGSGWSWIAQPQYNYHIRAVYGLGDAIGADLQIPVSTLLFQNYPNPFNPATNISFSLAEVSEVELSVYNIAGQKVADLINGKMASGIHNVDFDGGKLNSGVYYYRLVSSGKSYTRKMLLIK